MSIEVYIMLIHGMVCGLWWPIIFSSISKSQHFGRLNV